MVGPEGAKAVMGKMRVGMKALFSSIKRWVVPIQEKTRARLVRGSLQEVHYKNAFRAV
jgi:hypothetical protein